MTQQTPAQARVIDPVLTSVAQGFQQSALVAERLFPAVPVMQRGGRIVSFGRDDFRLYVTGRTPGANTKRVQYGYSGASFSLEQHALEGVVPIELMQDAQAVPGIDLATVAVRRTQNIIALRRERAAADLATTASNYPVSNRVTLSGTDQWSHASSNPANNLNVASDAVRRAIGRRPNTVLLGAAVMSALRNNPQIVERIKYTGRDSVTTDLLANLWDVERVVVGDAVFEDSAGVMQDLWGRFVVVAYTELGSLRDLGAPSYGYTYQLNGYPIVEQPYYDNNAKSWVYPVTDELQPVMAAPSAGYLISAAVA